MNDSVNGVSFYNANAVVKCKLFIFMPQHHHVFVAIAVSIVLACEVKAMDFFVPKRSDME